MLPCYPCATLLSNRCPSLSTLPMIPDSPLEWTCRYVYLFMILLYICIKDFPLVLALDMKLLSVLYTLLYTLLNP